MAMCRTRKYWNLFFLFGSSTTDSNRKGDPSEVVPHTDKRADNIIVEVVLEEFGDAAGEQKFGFGNAHSPFLSWCCCSGCQTKLRSGCHKR